MNDTQILEQLAKSDAFAPTMSMPASAWDRSTARSEIQRRIDMQTNTRKHPSQSREIVRGRPVWLAAAAGFAVVLILGLGLMLLARPSSESPATVPTTETPPPTTSVADTRAMTDALAEIAAGMSGTGMLPSVAEGVLFDGDLLTDYVDFAIALDTTVMLDECVFESTVATCRGTRTNVILEAMGYSEKAAWIIGFDEAWASGGGDETAVIVSFVRILDAESRLKYEDIGSTVSLEEDFIHWITATHPEWRDERGLGEFDNVVFDGPTGLIYRRYVDEYTLAIVENGPPALSYRLRW